MRLAYRRFGLGMCLLAGVAIFAAGCGKPQPHRAMRNKPHSHAHWWCDEHGLPEEECSLCDKKIAAACKEKGDWCETHKRAKSHCFICDPSLKEQFAKKHRDKYGKEPPPIGEFEKKG